VSRLRILYLEPGGVYRRQWVNQRQEEPVSIVNHKGVGQLHILRGAPIFTKAPPVDLAEIEELLTVPPPELSPLAEERLMLCEEDNPWPVGVRAEPLSEHEQKAQLRDMRQEWMQKSKGNARKRSGGEMSKLTNNAMVGIALGLGGLIFGIGVMMALESRNEDAEALFQVFQRLFT
jgi:hypothetical protein